MTPMHDSAARAACYIAYRRHGLGRFRPTARNPELNAYRRAVELGWLWEPLDDWLALTPDGVEAISAYRVEEPAG